MIEAIVQTGTFETRYRRAGNGGPVLLILGDGSTASSAGEWLLQKLAERCRVIAPALPAGLGSAEDDAPLMDLWLRGLIDGLGLERPALVADAAYGRALLRFAMQDPHRVDRLALLGLSEGDLSDPALIDAAEAALHPVLVVRPDIDHSLAGLLDFLADQAS